MAGVPSLPTDSRADDSDRKVHHGHRIEPTAPSSPLIVDAARQQSDEQRHIEQAQRSIKAAIDIEGALAPVVGRLVRRSISKVIALENHGFKTAAEAGVQSGGR